MANQINLTSAQIAKLNEITANGTANFPDGYRYISELIDNNPNVDSYTKFFFAGATDVNRNANSDSNIFIRSVTEAGLAWDGRLQFDLSDRAQQIQGISDDIARNIIEQINLDGGIPQIDTIINNDASLAVTDHGQTVGGWAGAFYYWNTRFTQPGQVVEQTVGQAILSDPEQYEKFIAINAQGLVETIVSQGGLTLPEQLLASFNAQVPAAVKGAIVARAYEVLTGEAQTFAGNPLNIDGYVPILDANERPIGWRLGHGEITDPVKIDELNHRYEIRLQKSQDDAWQLQRVGQIEENPDGTIVTRFAGKANDYVQDAKVTLDANGHILETEATGLDGSQTNTEFDQEGLYAWLSRTTVRDADRNILSEQELSDALSEEFKLWSQGDHPWKDLAITKDPERHVTNAQVTLDPQLASVAGGVGQIFGSAIGRALAGDNQFAQLAAGTVAGAIGQKLSLALATSLNTNATSVSFDQVFADFNISLVSSAGSTIASFLVAEIGEALGLDGYNQQLFNVSLGSYAGSVASQIANQMAGPNGVSFAAAVSGIKWDVAFAQVEIGVGSAIGSILANQIVQPHTQAGALGGQIMGAVGSVIAASFIIGQSVGWFLNMAIPGIGSLIGTLIGTILGDAFSDDPVRDSAQHTIDALGYSYAGNLFGVTGFGNATMSYAMASAAFSVPNALLAAIDGVGLSASQQLRIGYTDQGQGITPYYWVDKTTVTQYPDGEPVQVQVDNFHWGWTAEEVVNGAALKLLKTTDIIGGNLLMKRAFENSHYSDTMTLSGDLQVAQDYTTYLNNRAVINALIAANPNTAFAAGWAATFARVNDLGLNQYGTSDFFGGMVTGYLDSIRKAGLAFDASNVSVKHGSGNSVIIEIRLDRGADVPGVLSAFASQTNEIADATGKTVQFVFNDGLAAGGYHGPASPALVSGVWLANGTSGNNIWFGRDDLSNKFVGAAASTNIVVGGALNDELRAGNGGDFIDGAGGNDLIYGGTAGDILRGGAGNDTIAGGAGNDTLNGDGGDDSITGDDGDDVVRGGAGDDTLLGAAGADTLIGDDGADSLDGGAGDDILRGGAGADALIGGLGMDTADYASATQAVVVDLTFHVAVSAQFGTDTLSGIENVKTGSGNDTVAGDGATNVLDGGAGIDTLSYYAASSGVIIDLAAGVGVDGTSTDTLRNFENVNGSGYNDAISGTAGANVLDGLDGIDTISYYASAQGVTITLSAGTGVSGGIIDTLLNFENANGSAYSDVISGTTGANVLNGLGGIDTISYSFAGQGVTIDLAAGVGVDGTSTDTLLNFENAIGTAYNDTISSTAAANVLDGLGGIDTISYYASAQGVTINLTAGTGISGGVTDTLLNFENARGSAYDDVIAGTVGVNVLNGLGGIDTISYSFASQGVVIDLAAGVGVDGTSTDTLLNVENANGTAYNDIISSTVAANVLDGLGGIDTISYYASAQGVTIDLSAGTGISGGVTDTLLNFENANGSAYNDVISGTAGANVLNGLGGIDTISYSASAQGVTISLSSGTGVSGGVTDTLLNFENASGSAYNDVVSGTAGTNVLDGLGGIDTISYSFASQGVVIDLASGVCIDGTSTDTLLNFENASGTAYNDTISSTAAANVLDGLGGVDTVSYYKSTQGVTVDLSAGTGVSGGVTDTLLNFENVNGSAYADNIMGNGAANVLNGLGGADTLTGGGDSDVFVFAAGQANGDAIADFTGNGSAAGDTIRLSGFGSAAQGATFTQLNATQWQIHSGLDGHNETITLSNAAAVHASDFFFV